MRRRTVLAIGLGGLLRSQTPAAPAFEVAAIRQTKNQAPPPQGTAEGHPPPPPPPVLNTTPVSLTIENATSKYCLLWAYGMRNAQISGPEWINAEHYDICAKTGAPVAAGELKKMLQALLTERFRLVLRRDTAERPVLGLVVMRAGNKLTPAAGGGPASQNVTRLAGGTLRFEAKNTGLDYLEQVLSFPIWDPVVNLTGLGGKFDFTFERPPFRGHPEDILAEYKSALQHQLESGNPNPIAN